MDTGAFATAVGTRLLFSLNWVTLGLHGIQDHVPTPVDGFPPWACTYAQRGHFRWKGCISWPGIYCSSTLHGTIFLQRVMQGVLSKMKDTMRRPEEVMALYSLKALSMWVCIRRSFVYLFETATIVPPCICTVGIIGIHI